MLWYHLPLTGLHSTLNGFCTQNLKIWESGWLLLIPRAGHHGFWPPACYHRVWAYDCLFWDNGATHMCTLGQTPFCNNIVGDVRSVIKMGEQSHSYSYHANEHGEATMICIRWAWNQALDEIIGHTDGWLPVLVWMVILMCNAAK